MAKFTLSFNKENCKGCELCVNACPKGLLALDKNATNDAGYYPAGITDQEACIGCQCKNVPRLHNHNRKK